MSDRRGTTPQRQDLTLTPQETTPALQEAAAVITQAHAVAALEVAAFAAVAAEVAVLVAAEDNILSVISTEA